MSDIPFHATRMGHTFYEHTMPKLVRQLKRLNDLLERIADRIDEAAAQTDVPAKEKKR